MTIGASGVSSTTEKSRYSKLTTESRANENEALSLSAPAGTTATFRYAEMTHDGEISQKEVAWLVKSGEFQTDR